MEGVKRGQGSAGLDLGDDLTSQAVLPFWRTEAMGCGTQRAKRLACAWPVPASQPEGGPRRRAGRGLTFLQKWQSWSSVSRSVRCRSAAM